MPRSEFPLPHQEAARHGPPARDRCVGTARRRLLDRLHCGVWRSACRVAADRRRWVRFLCYEVAQIDRRHEDLLLQAPSGQTWTTSTATAVCNHGITTVG